MSFKWVVPKANSPGAITCIKGNVFVAFIMVLVTCGFHEQH